MQTPNSKMIEIARNARGLTQQQLAAKIPSLSQGNYSKIEKGLLPVSEGLMDSIANALDFPVSLFYYSRPIKDQSELFYRKRMTMPRKQQMRLEASIDLIKIWVDGLLTSIDIPEFSLPAIEPTSKTPADNIARKIRSLLKVPKGPIQRPINLLEKNGIIVHQLYEVPEKFDGITTITESGQRIIILNGDMPNDRKRLTLFHELGHIVMHLPFTPILDEDQDVEKEANLFAAEFLMPELEIRDHFARLRYSTLGDLKLYWKVSKAALIRRAKEIGLIDRDKYTYLMIELSRSGERKSETVQVELDSPMIIKKVIDAYTQELGYSMEELTSSISISTDDLYKYLLNSNALKKSVFRITV